MTLSEAADKLLDIGNPPDEFRKMKFTELRRSIIMQHLSWLSGYIMGAEDQPLSNWAAANEWLNAPIADILGECERIADTPEASE